MKFDKKEMIDFLVDLLGCDVDIPAFVDGLSSYDIDWADDEDFYHRPTHTALIYKTTYEAFVYFIENILEDNEVQDILLNDLYDYYGVDYSNAMMEYLMSMYRVNTNEDPLVQNVKRIYKFFEDNKKEISDIIFNQNYDDIQEEMFKLEYDDFYSRY